MPGRDYTQAYARLERTLSRRGDYDDIPEPYPFTKSRLVTPALFDWDDSYNDQNDSTSTLTPPPRLSALDQGLPPTPPSNPQLNNVSHGQSNGAASTSHRSPNGGLITPANQRSPPTPDTTPPGASHNLAPRTSTFGSDRQPSPYTESFRTAKEDYESTIGPTSDKAVSPEPEYPAPMSNYHDRQEELPGLARGINEDVLKPTNGEQPSSLYRPGAGLISSWDTVMPTENFDDDWNNNRFRNVTLRKKQRRMIDEDPSAISNEVNGRGRPISFGDVNELTRPVDGEQVLGAGSNDSQDDIEAPVTPPNPTSFRGHKSKHHSIDNGASPVIEALVVDTPPMRQHTLRHVSKNQSLRDEASVSSHSNRNSLNMEDLSPMRSAHKSHNGSDRKSRWSVDSDVSAGSRSLRRRNDIIFSRPMTAPEISSKDKSHPPELSRLNLEPEPTISETNTSRGVPEAFYYEDDEDMVDSAVERALFTKLSPSATPNVQERFHESPAPGGTFYNPVEATSEEAVEANPAQDPIPTHISPDDSFGRSTTTESMPRVSLDRSIGRSTDTSPQIFFNRNSLVSMTSGTPEVKEANAVNIYPHNNNSLLVVQNTPPASQSRGHSMAVEDQQLPTSQINDRQPSADEIEAPELNIEPATPITSHYNLNAVDSPLKNPRKAPELPVVEIIPPTPARELDAAEEAAAAVVPQAPPPVRRVSLLQKARRYSDTLIQPIKTFAGPKSGSLRQRAVSPPSVAAEETNLHPFWKPRRFWNDFSDSEDEYDDDYYDDEDHDRLPPGGDTSDTEPPATADTGKSKWRRGGSLRGFLIGNSLGLQRGPTNKRRHIVNLPPRLSEPRRSLQERRQMNAEASANVSAEKDEHTSVRASARSSATGGQKRSSSATRLWLDAWKSKRQDKSEKKDEKVREAQRSKLRASIGPVWYVERDDSHFGDPGKMV